MHADDQLQDSERSEMAADIMRVEGTIPRDVPLDATEEDLEILRQILYFDKIFVHGRVLPIEISEADLLQARDAYHDSEAMLAQEFARYFISMGDSANDEAIIDIEGISEPGLPDAPEESGLMHGELPETCLWVNEDTKQVCETKVLAGKKAMLAHLNVEHGVRGSDKDEVECQWAIFHLGSFQVCGSKFQRRHTPRHIASHLRLRAFCPYPGCGKDFSRSDQVLDHIRSVHQVQKGARRDTK